jgi:hypothetical protein
MNIKKTALFLLATLLIGTTCTNAQTLLDKLKKFAGPSDELIKMDAYGNYFLEDNGTVFLLIIPNKMG